MGTISFGPGLAGFPAFPLLPFEALANPGALTPEQLAQIQATFAALQFQFTETSFSFALDSTIFGVPGAFRYEFSFTGDFASLAADPSQLFAAFNPATAAHFLIRFQSAQTVDAISGRLAIAAEADTAGPPIPFALFFSTLLDPRNFTEDLLATFTGGQLAQFDTLDLSAFDGVISARSNGPTITRDGTISRPDGSFVDSDWGVVSFDGEVLSLAFSEVLGSDGDDVLGSDRAGASVVGAGGADLIFLEGAAASAQGGGGDDVLVAAATGVTLTGNGGADRFVIATQSGSTTVADFDASTDTLDLSAVARNARQVQFDATADGDLQLRVTAGPAIVLDGLTLADAASVRKALDLKAPQPRKVSALVGGADADRLSGGKGDDKIYGAAGDDRLAGDRGSDLLFGGQGDDGLNGGTGDDVLDGGDGDDVLVGGDGFDVVSGGYGADRFVLGGAGYDRLTDFELGFDRIDLTAFFKKGAVTEATFVEFVRVVPLGPTELTGFVQVDRDGAAGPRGWETVAQLDGAPFAIVAGVSTPQIAFADFVFG